MALFMAQGKLMYTFNIGQDKVRIKTQEKYNDGAWHNVNTMHTFPPLTPPPHMSSSHLIMYTFVTKQWDHLVFN